MQRSLSAAAKKEPGINLKGCGTRAFESRGSWLAGSPSACRSILQMLSISWGRSPRPAHWQGMETRGKSSSPPLPSRPRSGRSPNRCHRHVGARTRARRRAARQPLRGQYSNLCPVEANERTVGGAWLPAIPTGSSIQWGARRGERCWESWGTGGTGVHWEG